MHNPYENNEISSMHMELDYEAYECGTSGNHNEVAIKGVSGD